MNNLFVAESLENAKAIVAMTSGVVLILGFIGGCVWRWRRTRLTKLQEKYERLRTEFRRKSLDRLSFLEIEPGTEVHLPVYEVASRQVLVTDVLLKLADQHGGVDVCCPPLDPAKGRTGPCRWCGERGRPDYLTGRCWNQPCPATQDLYGVPEAIAV